MKYTNLGLKSSKTTSHHFLYNHVPITNQTLVITYAYSIFLPYLLL